MARYLDIAPTYLDDAAQRIVEMIPLAIAPTKTQIVRYIDAKMTPPFWWVYLGLPQISDYAEDISRQVYEVVGRYVIGYATQGYDGVIQQTVYQAIPQVLNYINSHRRLMFDNADGEMAYPTPPKYLDTSAVRASQASDFGAFKDGTNTVGIEIRVLLPFTIGLDQEY